MNVFIIAAVTADGFIGKNSGHSADWTSKEDKQLFVRLTKEAGVMVMGSTTFKTIGRALPGRKTIIYSSKPEAFADMEGDIEVTSESPQKLVTRLEGEGYSSLAICGGAQIYSLFLGANVVDELYITIEPIIFGKGVPLFSSPLSVQLELLEQSMLGEQSVLLHYKVKYD